MTIQVVSQVGALLGFIAAAALLALLAATLVQLGRRRSRSARTLGFSMACLVAAYAAALVAVGAASTPGRLNPGDIKCFDDWCAGMTGARKDGATSQLLVNLRLENRGRGRAMRSNLARAYVEVPLRGNIAPLDGGAMQTVIDAGGRVDIVLHFDPVTAASGTRFVVAEGSDSVSPGTFTIGDEVSPFHARAGWPLAGRCSGLTGRGLC